MNFSLTAELASFQEELREFAVEHVAPFAAANDLDHRFPLDPVKAAGSRGFLGVTAPKEWGGLGLGNLGGSLVTEELSRGCASVGVTASVHNSLVCTPIAKFGDDRLKERYLPSLVTGASIGAYALTEANAGSDAANQQTRAEKKGDRYVLNGTKLWITTGDHADVFVGFARTSTPDPTKKARGITAFVIERGFKGVRPGKKEEKCGIRSSSTTELVFEDCEVPEENVLGEVDDGFKIAMDTLDGGRVGIASQSVGIGQACLDTAIEYATTRSRGGKRLSRQQSIQWKIAEMATALDAGRLLVRRAACLRDAGEPCSLEASMAKMFASQGANRIAEDAVSILGLAGVGGDHPAERFLRDARITEIYEGTTEIQHLVIARHLLPRR